MIFVTGGAGFMDNSSWPPILDDCQELKIAFPEEIAYRRGYIDAAQLEQLAMPLKKNAYGRYLLRLLSDPDI